MSDLSKALKEAGGWSRDFTSDVLVTAGGTVLVWALARWVVFPIFGLEPPAGIGLAEVLGGVVAAITAYYFWKRARRDN